MSEEVSKDRVIYPVGTWRLHDITKLPICWILVEYDDSHDHQDPFTIIIHDGEKYRLYQGKLSERLYPIKGDLYGRRWESDIEDTVRPEEQFGVELVFIKDGLVAWELSIFSEENLGVSTYCWRRPKDNEPVSGLLAGLTNYRVSIYLDDYAIMLTDRWS